MGFVHWQQQAGAFWQNVCGYLLSSLESQFVILFAIAAVDLAEVEGLREKVVDQSAEGNAVSPRRRKVSNLNALKTCLKW